MLRGTALAPSTLETGSVDAVYAHAPVTALAFDSRGVTVWENAGGGLNGFRGLHCDLLWMQVQLFSWPPFDTLMQGLFSTQAGAVWRLHFGTQQLDRVITG